jgi:hypothetical protein
MMLEEEVVLVRSATNTSEDVALHKVVNVRAESVNNLARVSGMELLRSSAPEHSRRDRPRC